MILNFDLDNTLINLDTDFEWTLFYNKINKNYKYYTKIIYFFNKYNKNKLNINKYNYFIFKKNNFVMLKCKLIYLIKLFFNNLIKNKIDNKILLKINKIKILYKIIINTSTNKYISKFINYFINIKKSFQSNNKIIKKKYNINLDNNLNGISNLKSNKIKNFFYKKNIKIKINYFLTDSINDLIWFKKIIINNPDKLLFNISISFKKIILIKKNNRKLFF